MRLEIEKFIEKDEGYMRRTKIICTIGPASCSEEVMRELLLAGLNVARMNFSHGTHESHAEMIARFRKVRDELKLPAAVMLDTKGPEIRLGLFDEPVEVVSGQAYTFSTVETPGTAEKCFVNYAELPADVKSGDMLLVDDGDLSFRVEETTDTEIRCTVIDGGMMKSQKGVNIPGARLNMPFLSERDKSDLLFGIEQNVDYVAASFTRRAQDIIDMRSFLNAHGGEGIRIIAKIENTEGVEKFDEILAASDGIMVARGDMGVEIPLEDVPVIQKMIIKKVSGAGKVVITATQMLDSMMKHPRPTRAEATDVANAIYDGTSAIMLSGETAAGQYPIEALKTMVRIAVRTECDINYLQRFKDRKNMSSPDVTNAISHATCTMAGDLNAAAILAVSKSGRTARMISKYRPYSPIIGACLTEKVYRQLGLSWGVAPLLLEQKNKAEELFDYAVDTAEAAGLISKGDVVVLTAGVPLGVSGTTNLIKVQVAGHILVKGKGIAGKKIAANLCVCHSEEDLANFKEGDIIVAADTNNCMMKQMRQASGLIVEADSDSCHAAIAGLSLDIPVLIGAKNALEVLKSSAYVELDSENGVVTAI